jgi:transposase InsO family protein
VDNGPEFTSMAFLSWCEAKGVRVYFIDPGKRFKMLTSKASTADSGTSASA